MTIVGDIAQATGQWAHGVWDEILDPPAPEAPARRAELTVGYRIPAPIMELAARVLRLAAPDLKPPRSVREDGADPPIRRGRPGRPGRRGRGRAVARRARRPSTPATSP